MKRRTKKWLVFLMVCSVFKSRPARQTVNVQVILFQDCLDDGYRVVVDDWRDQKSIDALNPPTTRHAPEAPHDIRTRPQCWEQVVVWEGTKTPELFGAGSGALTICHDQDG